MFTLREAQALRETELAIVPLLEELGELLLDASAHFVFLKHGLQDAFTAVHFLPAILSALLSGLVGVLDAFREPLVQLVLL